MGEQLNITLLEETDSTNSRALAAARRGAEAGTVFIADRQTAGRGRRESQQRRRWFSPADKNLYLSVVLRPAIDVERASAITIAAGAELADMIRSSTGTDVELKWPNDLYVGDRKLGGILTEAVTGADGLKAVVVGVGINVNVEPCDFPRALREAATSLKIETGRHSDRLSLGLAAVRAIVEAGRQFREAGLEAWSERLERWNYLRDRRVTVRQDGQTRSGIARAIGTEGGLVVEFDDGRRSQIRSGEVDVEGLSRPAFDG